MTLDQFEDIALKAIRANFAARNVRVFSNKERQDRIQRQHRQKVRSWCEQLRYVRNPENADRAAKNLAWKIA